MIAGLPAMSAFEGSEVINNYPVVILLRGVAAHWRGARFS